MGYPNELCFSILLLFRVVQFVLDVTILILPTLHPHLNNPFSASCEAGSRAPLLPEASFCLETTPSLPCCHHSLTSQPGEWPTGLHFLASGWLQKKRHEFVCGCWASWQTEQKGVEKKTRVACEGQSLLSNKRHVFSSQPIFDHSPRPLNSLPPHLFLQPEKGGGGGGGLWQFSWVRKWSESGWEKPRMA